MTTDVLVALITLAGSAVGTFAGILVNSKLTNYRLSQLEKKVDQHNKVIDRVYRLEEQESVMEEKIRDSNHRIDGLEKKGV